ncbi:uncharacterized protein [Callorhinus ursinus]|uniref:uncharacterized protein n=1 Tax=Callorhinus ursinus TaxID=34884 RepID=UPI003CD01DFC
MAKSPRHSRPTPQPLPSLARLPNIPAVTCGPFRGEARGPGESEGGTAGRAKEEITRVHNGNVSAGPSDPSSSPAAGGRLVHLDRAQRRTKFPPQSPAGPALPTLQNLPWGGTHAAARIPFSFLLERDARRQNDAHEAKCNAVFLFRSYIRALLLTTVKTCLCQEVRYEDMTWKPDFVPEPLRWETSVRCRVGARTPPSAVAPASPPSAPPESRLRRFLGGWLGLAAAAAVLLCHARRRRRRRRRPELEGEEGRNLISPVAKGWRQTPSSPRAAREQGGHRYREGPSPRGRWIKNGVTPHSVTHYYIIGAKRQRLCSVVGSDSFSIITIFLQYFSQKEQGTMSQVQLLHFLLSWPGLRTMICHSHVSSTKEEDLPFLSLDRVGGKHDGRGSGNHLATLRGQAGAQHTENGEAER